MATGRKLEGLNAEEIWNQTRKGEVVIVHARCGHPNPLRYRVSTKDCLEMQFKILKQNNAPVIGCYANR